MKTRYRRGIWLLALLSLAAALLAGCGEFPRLERLRGEEALEPAALEITLDLSAPEGARVRWTPTGQPAEGVEAAVREDASGEGIITIRIPHPFPSQRR